MLSLNEHKKAKRCEQEENNDPQYIPDSPDEETAEEKKKEQKTEREENEEKDSNEEETTETETNITPTGLIQPYQVSFLTGSILQFLSIAFDDKSIERKALSGDCYKFLVTFLQALWNSRKYPIVGIPVNASFWNNPGNKFIKYFIKIITKNGLIRLIHFFD